MKRISLFLLIALGNVTMYGADGATTQVTDIKKMAEELASMREKANQAELSKQLKQDAANRKYEYDRAEADKKEAQAKALSEITRELQNKATEAEIQGQKVSRGRRFKSALTRAGRKLNNAFTYNSTIANQALAENSLLPAVEPTKKDAAKKKAGKSGDAWYETAYNDTAEWIENNPIYTAVGAGVGAAGLGSILAYRAASKYRRLSDAQFEEAMDKHSFLYVGLAKFGRYMLGVKDIHSPYAQA